MHDRKKLTSSPPKEKALEGRMTIITRKAKAENLTIPYEVLAYIAQRADIDNDRLEGALIRVMVYSSVVNREITIGVAAEALKDINITNREVIDRKRNKSIVFSKLLSRGAMISMLSGIILLNGCELGNQASAPVETVEKSAKVSEVSIQQDIALSGQVEPFQVVAVTSAVSGNVKEIHVDLGSYVKKDQLLVNMGESDLAYKIVQAETAVKKAEVDAKIKAIEQQISLNDMKVALSTAPSSEVEEQKYFIKKLQVELENSAKNQERMDALFSQGAVSQEQMEEAHTQKIQVENDLNKAKKLIEIENLKDRSQKESAQAVAKLQQQSSLATTQLTKMGVEQAKANLEIIRYQYNNLEVRSPISGFITEKNVMMGQAVSSADSIFVITNLDKVYVKVDVPEALIPKIKVDQKASVNIPTLSKSLEGTVSYIAQVGNSETRTFPIKILVDNVNHEIKGGMTAQVSLVHVEENNSK